MVLALFAAASVVFTYPLILQMSTATLGVGDSRLQMWAAWWRKITLLEGLDYRILSLSQAPFTTDNLKWFFRPGFTLALALIAIPFGEVFAYNLSIIAGLALSGYVTYRLLNPFMRRRAAAVVGGLIFAFSAYAYSHALAHAGLTQQWVLPLFVMALFSLQRRQSLPAAAGLGVAFVLALDVQGYYGYFVTILALLFAATEAAAQHRRGGWRAVFNRQRILLYAAAALIGLLIYLPVLIPALRAYIEGPASPLRSPRALVRDDHWFFWLSSRPWSFLLPPAYHPALGGASQAITRWLDSLPYPDFTSPGLSAAYPDLPSNWFWHTSFDQYLPIAYTALALGGIGFARWRHGALPAPPSGEEPARRELLARYAAILLITAFLFSLPPYLPVGAALRPLAEPLHGINLPTLSWLTLTLTPPLRSVGNFVTLMVLALAILGALGLDALLAAQRRPAGRAALLASIIALLSFEYAHPLEVKPIEDATAYRWLADRPPGTIVQVYPYGGRRYGFFQTVHQQPTIDSMHEDPLKDNIYQIERVVISSPDRPGAAERLAALGARYVVMAEDRITTPPGYALRLETPATQVFEVLAEPAPLVVLYTLCCDLWQSDAAWGWQGESFRIIIWNPLNEEARITVQLQIAGDPAGAQLAAFRSLTPMPESLPWSGTLIPNPLYLPDYAPEGAPAARAAGGLAFPDLAIRPGETLLDLRWERPGRGGYPRVTAIRFERTAPTLP